jgi:hypothetical protein
MYTKNKKKTLIACKNLRPKSTQKKPETLLGSQYLQSTARSIYTWILDKSQILEKLL